MKSLIKNLPLPVCGLILGATSVGNLLKDLGLTVVGNLYGICGMFFMLLVMLKVVFYFPEILQELKQPVIASVSPTFSMSWMIICTYLLPILPYSVVFFLWGISVLIHLSLMVYFTLTFAVSPPQNIQKIFPSWFIMYVGVGVITVTSVKFYLPLGLVMFYLGLILYLFLLPLVLYRMYKVKDLPESALPLTTILAAPGSLLLAGYLKAFSSPVYFLVISLFVLSQVLYGVALTWVKKNLALPFYASYAAFTFPLVITATACYGMEKYLAGNIFQPVVRILRYIEVLVAALIVVYVFFRYGKDLIEKNLLRKESV